MVEFEPVKTVSRLVAVSLIAVADGANAQEGLFITMTSGMTPEPAAKTYAVLLTPSGGFDREARLDLEGIRTVLTLRSEYGEPRKELTDPAPYYDLSYYERASAPR